MRDKIPYGTQNITDDDIDSVINTLKSEYMTQGPKIEEFENIVASYHNCKYAVAYSNGTAALHGAYFASGIQKGDEFITTPITFVASANAGLYLGATPKFVDINSIDHNIDISKIESAITNKTKVLTPVSFGGYPVYLKEIKQIADKHNLVVIHDAAHAIGAKRDGYGIVDYADMTILSFHPVKHVATGEGGMVLTNDEQLYKKLKLFRTHGIIKDQSEMINYDGGWYYEMSDLGYNYRITDMQSALGISQMSKLNDSIIKRNMIAERYDKELVDVDFIKLPNYSFQKLNMKTVMDIDRIQNINSYHLYPILLRDKNERKEFYNYMRKNNILVQVHYIPVHTMPYYKEHFGFSYGDYPNAENFYEREISLPMYPTLTYEEQSYVIETIKNFHK